MLRTSVGRLRVIAFAEGLSYLALLGVAMPLKYLAGMPGPVKAVGWAHGLLFVLYLLSAADAAVARRWSVAMVLGVLAAAFIPLGTFVLDARLRREEGAG